METPILVDEAALVAGAAALCDVLRARGCRPGDRVALYAGNSPAFVVAREAASAADLCLVPINPAFTAPEIAYILGHARPLVVLVEPSRRATIEAALAAPSPEPAPWIHTLEATAAAPRPAASAAPLFAPGASMAERIGATLLYTSGTTGHPKGCMRSADQEAARALELVTTYGLGRGDVHLIACPLAHSAPGILLRAGRWVGTRTVLLPRFRPESFLAAAAAHRASVFFLVPTQYERLLAVPDPVRSRFDLSAVRVAIVAGAPIASETKKRIVTWLGPGRLWEFYGSSETGTIAVLPPDLQLAKPGSAGRPPAGVEVRVLDPAGRDVACGEVGEIFVRSAAVMAGYLDPESSAVALPERGDGFVSVGDLGFVDGDGFLYLVDRKHDTIISGGVNVYPAEVERALAEHPAVQGAVVFALPDPDWGQIVAAAIVADSVDAGELSRFLRLTLAPFKVPKAFAFVTAEELPVGASGKPLRRRAQAMFQGSPRLQRLGR